MDADKGVARHLTAPLFAVIILAMDKLRALRTLIAIADSGSLTAASDALKSSLPAVVRTLAALEANLGTRLINRTTRRLSLTENGRQYLERARRIVADLDEADRLAAAEQAEPAGAMRVTAPVLFGQYHVAPVITRFLQRHPRVRVDLMLLDRVVDLVEEGIDVGVRIGHLHDSTLVAQPVGAIRRVVVASPEFLGRHGTPTHPSQLADASCLRFNHAEGARWTFQIEGRHISVTVQGPLECNLAAPMLEACVAGLGFGRCLSYQAAPFLNTGRLRIVLEDFEIAPWPVNIVYPSARLLPSRTRALIAAIKPELAATL